MTLFSKVGLLPWMLVLAFAGVLRAEHYQLFVLTGQSNSLGTTNGGESDPSPGTDPASDPGVLFYWHNVVDATTSIGDSGGQFLNLQAQQGGVYAGSATHWGPEIEFARDLYRGGVRNFGIIKASRGGGGNTFWHKASGGHMYQHVVDTVTAATTQLTNQGDTFEIVGLLYLQGESDSSSEAAIAGSRIKELTDNLRADLPNATKLETVIGGITISGGTRDTVKANQQAIADSTAYIHYFDNTDQAINLAPDNLHLAKLGKQIVGRRYAQTFFDAGVVSRQYGKLVFIGDSITQGGNGNPSYRYRVFEQLALKGVPQNAATGYEFVGSVTGAYQSNPGPTPDVNGQTFSNTHDGHWGWRVFWSNGRIPLPSGRYNVNNLGNGTVENWTGQSTTYETADNGSLTYSGTTYTPDSAVIMMGINDIAGGSQATQVRDDIELIIDQLRAASPGVAIYLCEILHTDQGQARQDAVDDTNALLATMAGTKSTPASPIWLMETNQSFDPVSLTYDAIHPNTAGEIEVGGRIAAGMALGVRNDTPPPPAKPIIEKAGPSLGCEEFLGSDIWNTGSYASNWSAGAGINPSSVGTSSLRLDHPGSSADVLDGTNTSWQDINDGLWSLQVDLQFDANPNGFIFWIGTGTHRILIDVQADRTRDFGANSFEVLHNNVDGQSPTFRIDHDPTNDVYHVFRDGVRLTPLVGAPYDQTASDGRLLFGDYTSGTYGDGFNVVVNSISFCPGFSGNQIYDGTSWVNGWSFVGGVSPTLGNTELQVQNTTAGGSWIEGTNTGWSANCSGYWTFETRLKFDSNPNGFQFWLGAGTDLIQINLFADRTEDNGNNSFSVAHDNADGAFHDFRVSHDPDENVYHLWRDGERLTPIAGAPYDSTLNETRLILGDTTGGALGNGFDATIAYVRYEFGSIAFPPGADADLDGIHDLWELEFFGSVDGANAALDSDSDGLGNLLEFAFGTNPSQIDNQPLAIDGSVNGTPLVNVEYTDPFTFDAVFMRRKDHASTGRISYQVEFSNDLSAWEISPDTPVVESDSLTNSDYEIVSVPYPFFLNDGRKARFFRVNILNGN